MQDLGTNRIDDVDKNYAYLVPSRRPMVGDELTSELREFPSISSGLVVRVDLTTFATVDSLDLTLIHPHLGGFSGAIRGMSISCCFQATNGYVQ